MQQTPTKPELQAIAALKTLGSARAMELFKDVEESWQL